MITDKMNDPVMTTWKRLCVCVTLMYLLPQTVTVGEHIDMSAPM